MSEKVQTLVACERCGRGWPYRDMTDVDDELWCRACLDEVNAELKRQIAEATE